MTKRYTSKIPMGICMLAAVVLVTMHACKERNDWPDFSNYQPELPPEDSIPPDNIITPIVQKIQAGSDFFKTFLIDSSIAVHPGFDYTHVRFVNSLDQKVSMHILEIDQSIAKASIMALSPFDDYIYGSQVLTEMMLHNQERASENIIAAIVGDAFSAGTPSGTYVRNGRVIKTNTSRTLPYVGVRKGSRLIEVLNSPSATDFPSSAIVPEEFQHLIAGQNWMLYKNSDIIYTTTTTVARTAIGFNADRSKVYCISVDGVNAFSAGISLNNMRTVFRALSCTDAIYTNGSAANSLAIRHSNGADNAAQQWILKNFPVSTTAPLIANGIGFVVTR